jgi:CHAD domain-containing protein
MVGTEVREVERKYDVDWSTPIPDLKTLPGVAEIAEPVEHELVAEYVDTADLALAANRVTLRRRTGGDDDGWHLKLPGSGDERDELRRPAGTSARRVPVQLARLVRVHARGQALTAVATLRTRRVVHRLIDAEGAVLAEVCDDRVSAQVGDTRQGHTWREWEVELVTGDEDLLDAAGQALLDAGAQPAQGPSKLARALGDRVPQRTKRELPPDKPTAGDVLMAYVAEQVEEIKRRDPDVRRDVPDGVHKMRVAMRRLRSALATYRPVLDRSVTDPIRDEVRRVAGELGPARDLEVLREHLLAQIDAEPPELLLGRVRQTVDIRLRGDQRDALKRAVAALDDPRYLHLLDTLDRLVAAPPLVNDVPAEQLVGRLLRHDWKRLSKRVDAAFAAPKAERDPLLHEARKAAKRVRYAAESASPVFGERADTLVGRAKKIQNHLGAHQDAVVFRPAIRQLAVQAHLGGGNGFSYGRLHALEQWRADQAEETFAQRWAKESARYPKSWMR